MIQRIADENTKGGNEFSTKDAARRYKERQDLYNAELDRSMIEGQFEAGGANVPRSGTGYINQSDGRGNPYYRER